MPHSTLSIHVDLELLLESFLEAIHCVGTAEASWLNIVEVWMHTELEFQQVDLHLAVLHVHPMLNDLPGQRSRVLGEAIP